MVSVSPIESESEVERKFALSEPDSKGRRLVLHNADQRSAISSLETGHGESEAKRGSVKSALSPLSPRMMTFSEESCWRESGQVGRDFFITAESSPVLT